MLIKKSIFVIIFLQLTIISATILTETHEQDSGVFGKIKSGLQMAGKFLGLDRASTIAELVSETFGKISRQSDDEQNSNSGVFSGFFRLLGLDVQKIGAIAINGIIFIAQLISTSFTTKQNIEQAKTQINQGPQPRGLKPGTPLEWILSTDGAKRLMNTVKDDTLSDQIISIIKEHNKEDTDCVELLICKSKPFIKGMQMALKDSIEKNSNRFTEKSENLKDKKRFLFKYLPDVKEFVENGNICESKYPNCNIV